MFQQNLNIISVVLRDYNAVLIMKVWSREDKDVKAILYEDSLSKVPNELKPLLYDSKMLIVAGAYLFVLFEADREEKMIKLRSVHPEGQAKCIDLLSQAVSEKLKYFTDMTDDPFEVMHEISQHFAVLIMKVWSKRWHQI